LIKKNTVATASVFVLEDSAGISPLVIDHSLSLLSKSEIERYTKMKNPKRRRQFVISRLLLLEGIKRQLGVRVTVDSSVSGQPIVIGHPIFCSISYSDFSISVSFSTYGPIGVDIEKHRQRKIDRLVRYCFHMEEIDYFDALSENQRELWFYRQWTLKEAAAKANGEGISLRTLGVKIDKDDINKVTSVVHVGNSYSLACVHHSDQPIQLAYIIIRDSTPWVEYSLRDWSDGKYLAAG
jgi:4'-phosphopantetheinyl transferase